MDKKEFEKYMDSISERNPKTGAIIKIKIPELNYKEVTTWNFNKSLKEIGLTRQQWVNIHRYGDIDYLPICPYCNKRPLKFNVWEYRTSCCCRDCMNKQIEEQNKSDELREKIRNSVKKLWEDEEYRCIQSKSHKNVWRDEDTVNRLMKTHYIPPLNSSKKSEILSIYENEIIRFDSTWEEKFFSFMSSNSEVKVIKRLNLKLIKYFSSKYNKERWYKPDFEIEYTDGRKELIEIKPYYQLEDITVKEKKEAAEKWCKENNMKYVILTEIELRNMGIHV